MIKLENFWIALLWAIIFMVILPWDQEKIVVLNLVLFCYFLRYLIGDTIENSLSQRRIALLDSLVLNLNTELKALRLLIEEAELSLRVYKSIVLSLTNKIVLFSNSLLLNKRYSSMTSISFAPIQVLLQVLDTEVIKTTSDQNLFVSSQILSEVAPTLVSSEDEEK